MSDHDEPRATVTPLRFAANLAKTVKLPNDELQEAWEGILLRLEQSRSQLDLGSSGTYAVAWIAALTQAKVISMATHTELFVARDRVYAQAAQRLKIDQ